MGSSNSTSKLEQNMKLGLVFISAATATKSWMTKEWEVITAYDADEEIALKDPLARSNRQWHDCGDKPATPAGARDVRCNGTLCATVCKRGYRSKGAWKTRCQADNTWSRKNLSPCITCDHPKQVDSSVAVQSIFRKNLPVHQYFCGDSTSILSFAGTDYTKGGNKKNVKCLCKKQGGQKTCGWSFKNKKFSQWGSMKCTSTQPNNSSN